MQSPQHAGTSRTDVLDMTSPILTVKNLDVLYGTSQALFGVSVEVQSQFSVGRARSKWGREEHAGPKRLGTGSAICVDVSRSMASTSPDSQHTGFTGAASRTYPRAGRCVSGSYRARESEDGRSSGAPVRTADGHGSSYCNLPSTRVSGVPNVPAACRGANSRCLPWREPWRSFRS